MSTRTDTATSAARLARPEPHGCLRLCREQVLGRSPSEVFEFFADPANLEPVTPPWLRFRIVDCSTDRLGEGSEIRYRLRVRGFPVRWRSAIVAWEPPHRFADLQLAGPYRYWHHVHRFEPRAGGTLMTDEVTYKVPGGKLVDRFLVRPDLERIFDHRRDRMAELLG